MAELSSRGMGDLSASQEPGQPGALHHLLEDRNAACNNKNF